MIERETPSDKERPLVASVIYNRLAQGEPLGIDATIRYAENNWTRPLRESELERDGPYNTRLRQGLPPTPIGNPGLASLKAAAHAGAGPTTSSTSSSRARATRSPSTDAEFERDVAAYDRARRAERRQGAAAEVLTRLGVAGWPVAHSRSPAMHNAALAAAGLHDWRYLKLPLPPERFAETVRALPAAGFRGINVTIPHKEAALALADEATPTRGRRRRGEHAHVRARRARSTPTTPTCPACSRRCRVDPAGHDGARAGRGRRRARRGVRAAQRRARPT